MARGLVTVCIIAFAVQAGVRTSHYSFWSDDPQPYLRAIQQTTPGALPQLHPGQTIRAGIVTHHFLASGLMVRFFQALSAGPTPDSVVLIGPNHFHHGSANVSFSSLPWKTPFGILETDQAMVQQLESAIHLPEDPEAFTGEHSLGVLIPFLKYYFPHGRVVPILVDVNARETALSATRGILAGWLRNPRVLVVLSMDFSHNSTADIADSRDHDAQQAISDLDLNRVEGLNVDCRKGLWLLMAGLLDLGSVKAQFVEHTNSSRLTGNPRQPDVTSYFTVYFTR